MKMSMTYTGDKVTDTANTAMVWVSVRSWGGWKQVQFSPIKVYKPPEFSSQIC